MSYKKQVTCPRCKGSGMENILKTMPNVSIKTVINEKGDYEFKADREEYSYLSSEKKVCTLCKGKGLMFVGWEYEKRKKEGE